MSVLPQSEGTVDPTTTGPAPAEDPAGVRAPDPSTLPTAQMPPPPPPPASEADCRAAFEHLVALSVAQTRHSWLAIGRIWDDAAHDEAEATVRDGEARAMAGCLRRMTRPQTACQAAARSPAAWRQCSGAR